jgi:hypothetical protein
MPTRVLRKYLTGFMTREDNTTPKDRFDSDLSLFCSVETAKKEEIYMDLVDKNSRQYKSRRECEFF